MKTLFFTLALLLTATTAKANVTTLYITSENQPLQVLTVASCDTLFIVNQTFSPSYAVWDDSTGTGPGWPMGSFIPDSWIVDSLYLYDLTSYTALTVTHQGSSELFYITVTPGPQSTISATICHGSSYLFNGEERTATGTYLQYISTAGPGCDSVVRLELTVLPPVSSISDATICYGTSYSFQGNEYTTTGTFSDTIQTASGCDSILFLNLTVMPALVNTINAAVCHGSAYPFMGNDYTEAGDYPFVFQTPDGCDSTVILHLTYEPGGNVSIFQMDEHTLSATSPVTFNFLWLACDNNYAVVAATNGSFTATQSGSYAVMAIHNGCADTSECILLEEAGLEEASATAFFIYPVPSADQVTITTDEVLIGLPYYLMDLSGKTMLNGTITSSTTIVRIADLTPGMYVLRIGGGMQKILRE